MKQDEAFEDEPEVKAAFSERAAAYADDVLRLLWEIAQISDSDASRVAAGKEILDRAYGKPAQSVTSTTTQITPDDISWAGNPNE
jgi:hypothetical protein